MPFFGPLSLSGFATPSNLTPSTTDAFQSILAQHPDMSSPTVYPDPNLVGYWAGMGNPSGAGGASPMTESVTGAIDTAGRGQRESMTGALSDSGGLIGGTAGNVLGGVNIAGAANRLSGLAGGPTVQSTLSPMLHSAFGGTGGSAASADALAGAVYGGGGAAGAAAGAGLYGGLGAGQELGLGIGATLPAAEAAGPGLLGSLGWAALPLGIFAASGAFGSGIQRLLGFGNNEQMQNQIHEANVLQRDLGVAVPQARAGQQAVFDLGTLASLSPVEQAQRLQELQHTIQTGLNAGLVFSRAGGPDRGTQDLDLQIGLIRATDALNRLGLNTLEGRSPTLPTASLANLNAYARGPADTLLPFLPTIKNPEDEFSGKESGYSFADPGFAAGQFEQGLTDFYRTRYPGFAESALAQRMSALPSLHSLLATSSTPGGRLPQGMPMPGYIPPTPSAKSIPGYVEGKPIMPGYTEGGPGPWGPWGPIA